MRRAWVLVAAAMVCAAATVEAQSRHTAVDGDTFDWRRQRYRLVGVDTPETRGCEPETALRAKARLQELLDQGVRLRSVGVDPYRRKLAIVWQRETGYSLSDILIREGLGRPYYGSGPHPWCQGLRIAGQR